MIFETNRLQSRVLSHAIMDRSFHWMGVDVTFGVFSRQCSGSGICSIKLPQQSTSVGGCSSIGIQMAKMEGERIALCILMEKITCQRQIDLLSRPYFQMEESFELPLVIRHKLKIEGKYITSGIYPNLTKGPFRFLFLNTDAK